MSESRLNVPEELGESWVELGPRSGTPLPSVAEEYLRLLREAQRESNSSSARQSLASSRIDSPKSPPNSPNTEPNTEDELRGIFINYCGNKLKEAHWDPLLVLPTSRIISSSRSLPISPNTEPNTEDDLRSLHYGNKDGELNAAQWVSQWSSRPDQRPPDGWNFKHPVRKAPLSLRKVRVGGKPLFAKDLVAPLLLSNLLSLLLGAGIGVWFCRRAA